MKKDGKWVQLWLLSGCVLIFLMVLIGGITRLTHSGLSISNYKLISGTIPPLSQSEWEAAFDLYKQYPEYQKLNTHFDINDFKAIYFWEWLHRVIGRLIGLVFIIPFVFFLIKKRLSRPTLFKSLGLLFLGGLQGFLGWYMVKSGLVNQPDVSHYRLAIHLLVAFFTFGCTFWVFLQLKHKTWRKTSLSNSLKRLLALILAVLFLQLAWGAFVAGLDAGFVHNFWPLMSEGYFMHPTVYSELEPIWRNFVEGRSGVQFVHRLLGVLLLMLVAVALLRSRRETLNRFQQKSISLLAIITLGQFILGVLTLLFGVPLVPALLHQTGAFLMLSTLILALFYFRYAALAK